MMFYKHSSKTEYAKIIQFLKWLVALRYAQYSRCERSINCLTGMWPQLDHCWPTPTVQFVHCYSENLEKMSERKAYRSILVNRLCKFPIWLSYHHMLLWVIITHTKIDKIILTDEICDHFHEYFGTVVSIEEKKSYTPGSGDILILAHIDSAVIFIY